jgi:hypothetical protein
LLSQCLLEDLRGPKIVLDMVLEASEQAQAGKRNRQTHVKQEMLTVSDLDNIYSA